MWALFAVYQAICKIIGIGAATAGVPPGTIRFPHVPAVAADTVAAFSLSRPTRARHVPAEDPRPGAFVRDRPDRASPRRIKNFSDFPAREAGQPSVTSVTRKIGFHLFSPDLIT
jgi:hypothetical protein